MVSLKGTKFWILFVGSISTVYTYKYYCTKWYVWDIITATHVMMSYIYTCMYVAMEDDIRILCITCIHIIIPCWSLFDVLLVSSKTFALISRDKYLVALFPWYSMIESILLNISLSEYFCNEYSILLSKRSTAMWDRVIGFVICSWSLTVTKFSDTK